MISPSKFDQDTYELCREHLNKFIEKSARNLSGQNIKVLEIGAQGRSDVSKYFSNSTIETLDIVNDHNPTYLGDITKFNDHIPDSSFDIICCLEVLEHTLNPFSAAVELRRLLKDGGYLLASAPLNWRIHGPIPDCWRFTEFGWRVLLKDFEIIEIDKLETPDRNLFPMKYNILAKCDKNKNIDVYSIKFDRL
jgi:SAM-dependent methyltransferase